MDFHIFILKVCAYACQRCHSVLLVGTPAVIPELNPVSIGADDSNRPESVRIQRQDAILVGKKNCTLIRNGTGCQSGLPGMDFSLPSRSVRKRMVEEP